MKKLNSLILIFLAATMAFTGCAKPASEIENAVDVTETPAPTENASGTSYGHNAGVAINASTALVYEGSEGTVLYGAVEYENTGDCPVYISRASFVFTVDGTDMEYNYEPSLAEYTVVLPGCISYEAVWLTDRQVSIDSTVSLRASLTAVESPAPRIALEVDELYTADNYPGFSTLSGRISCRSQTGCSANVIYVGFYDSANTFLGAWYFSKNAVLEAGDPKNFVVNMREFPVSGLASKVAFYKSAAFGFDF